MNAVTGVEEGKYHCRAENAAGTVEAAANLRIQELPRIRLDPSGSVTLPEGSSLDIKCLASGIPTPRISWKKLGQYIKN